MMVRRSPGFHQAKEMVSNAMREHRPMTEGEIVKAKAALHAARTAESKTRGGTPTTEELLNLRPGGPFKNLGEQLQAVMRTQAGQHDQRLSVIDQASGLNTGTPSDGGFLLQETFREDLLLKIWDTSRVAPWCWRVPVSAGNVLKLPAVDESARTDGARHGGTLSYWMGEAGELTPSAPKFKQLRLELRKLATLCYATDEMLNDSQLLTAVMTRLAVAEMSFALDDAIINGTGGDRPLGVLNGGGVVTVAKDSEQTGETISFGNIVGLWKALLPASRATAVWCVSPSAETELYKLALQVGDGGAPVFLPGGGLSAAPYTVLLGRPVVVCEQLPELGTAGDILLADFAGGYVLAEKGGIESASSIHVRFAYDETAFRFILRVDGMPVLAEPITAFKGTLQQGHFAMVETRD